VDRPLLISYGFRVIDSMGGIPFLLFRR
jgi:hypothetical protein